MSVGRHPDVNGNLTLSIPGWSGGGESFRDPQRHFDYGGHYTPPGTPPLLGGSEPDAGELCTLVTLPSVGMDVEIAFYYNSHSRETTWAGFKRTCNLFLVAKACGTPISGGPFDGALPQVMLRRGNGARSTYTLNSSNGTFTAGAGCERNRLFYDSDNELWIEKTPDGRQTAYAAKWWGCSSPVLWVQDAVGNRHTFQYDGQGHLESLEDAAGRLVEFEFGKMGDCDVLQSLTDWAGRTTTFEYDGDTLPRKPLLRFAHTSTAANGVAQTEYQYDNKGRVTAVIDAEGFRTSYVLQRNGKVRERKAIDSDGTVYSTFYRYGATQINNQWRCVTQAEDATQKVTTSLQDERLRVVGVRTRLGQKVAFGYNARGYETVRLDPAERTWQTFYDSEGFPYLTQDANQRAVNIQYDQFRNPTFITQGWDGAQERFVWTDPNGDFDASNRRLHQHTSGENISSFFSYYPNGLLLQAWDEVSDGTAYEYDDFGNLISSLNALNQTTFIQPDAAGNPLVITDEAQVQWTYTYDEGNRVLTGTVPLTSGTQSQYDRLGNLTYSEDAAGQWAGYEHNIFGLVNRVEDARPQPTLMRYDSLGRFVEVQDPEGNLTTTFYDQQTGSGQPVAAIKRLSGNVESRNYAFLGYGVRTADERGFLSNTIFDLAGRALVDVDETGNETWFEYDPIGRVKKVINALQQPFEVNYDLSNGSGRFGTKTKDALNREVSTFYDRNTRTLEFRDELNALTRHVHDAGGRLHQIWDAKNPSPTVITPDAMNQVRGVQDPKGQITGFDYDPRGPVKKITDALTRSRHFDYNAAGDLAYRKDERNRESYFESDGVGRTRKVRYGSSQAAPALSYEFDSLGRLNQMADVTGATGFGYDNADNLTGVTYPGNRSLGYVPDEAGNRQTLSATGQDDTGYEYDEAGRLTKLINPFGEVTRFNYDALGRQSWQHFANGLHAHRTWDAVGRDAVLEYRQGGTFANGELQGGTLVARFTTTYPVVTVNGQTRQQQVVSEENATGLVTTTTYLFDKLYQLVKEERVGEHPYSIAYEYDSAGNRSQKVENGITTTYSYNVLNQLTGCQESGVSAGGSGGGRSASYSYDANGNVETITQDGVVTTLAWNREDQLEAWVSTDGGGESYVYGADGMRRRKDDGNSALSMVWDGANLLQEVDGAGVVVSHYSDSPGAWGNLTSQRKGSGSRFFVFDQSGNTRLLLDASGSVTDSFVQTAFGVPVAHSGSSTTPYGFGGEVGYYSDGSGRFYVRNRLYDAHTGRWLSRDPIGFDGGDLNLYAYCGNDPVNQIDPDGLLPSPKPITPPVEIPIRPPLRLVPMPPEMPWWAKIASVTGTGIMMFGLLLSPPLTKSTAGPELDELPRDPRPPRKIKFRLALGLWDKGNLAKFASKHRAVYFGNWSKVGIKKLSEVQLEAEIFTAMVNARSIYFRLDPDNIFSSKTALKKGPQGISVRLQKYGPPQISNATNWEYYLVRRYKFFAEKTVFWRNGKKVRPPQIK